MKNLSLAILVSLLVAPSAFAGSAGNRWTNGYETGTSNVKVDNYRVETGEFTRETLNVKIDATTDQGGTATVTAQFDDEGIKGNAFATTNQVDPYVIYGRSYNLETGAFTDATKVNVLTETEFGSTFYDHTLTTDW